MAVEGNLQAPTRHNIDWQSEDYYNKDSLYNELERVFDLCHGCRRCVSLCDSFPTLFDLVDESQTMEVDGVAKEDYKKVIDACYLCDLCYMTKCPYTPPHDWNIDFPHLMLRAKAYNFKNDGSSARNKFLAATHGVGKAASFPAVDTLVNAINNNGLMRNLLEKTLGLHKEATLPKYDHNTASKQLKKHQQKFVSQDKVVLFITCYGEYNSAQSVMDLVAVLNHNNVEVITVEKEKCCGMPKLEMGDLDSVTADGIYNVNKLVEYAKQGYKILAPVPSCGLMFKQELPLLLPDDENVALVSQAICDPFEYLLDLNKQNKLDIESMKPIDKTILYHAACHQRVQNIGSKTKELLELIPSIEVKVANRCSGHDGTYGVKKETYESALKICKPITRGINQDIDYISSDCLMAGNHISHVTEVVKDIRLPNLHPVTILKMSYGL